MAFFGFGIPFVFSVYLSSYCRGIDTFAVINQ